MFHISEFQNNQILKNDAWMFHRILPSGEEEREQCAYNLYFENPAIIFNS